MNPLATELNNAIQAAAPAVYEMLSALGRELYMPKGILTQGAEAKQKAHKFNATLGVATENSHPMYLDCIYDNLKNYNPADLFLYAPTTGKPELRKAWQDKMLKENPSLHGKQFGLPVSTNALTHGLSIVANLFVNDGDYVVLPDKFWGNYRLAFSTHRGGVLTTFPIFNDDNGFNVEGLLKKVEECGKLRPKVVVVLNFPNNPTGYTPTLDEANRIVRGLKEIADSGIKIIAVTDDAYFGMFYENSIKESLFGMLAGVSSNLLAVKLDGATKESFVWGFRVGFITFAATTKNDESAMLSALEQKVSGNIRGNISSGPHISQSIVLNALKHPDYEKQHAAKVEILKARAVKSKEVLANPEFADEFVMYPFNSGYFLCLRLLNTEAEKLRVHLLDKYGVGTIAAGSNDLRIAFSCMEVEDMEELFSIIYQGCKDLRG